jgi:hypothetical protein
MDELRRDWDKPGYDDLQMGELITKQRHYDINKDTTLVRYQGGDVAVIVESAAGDQGDAIQRAITLLHRVRWASINAANSTPSQVDAAQQNAMESIGKALCEMEKAKAAQQ